MNLCPCNVHSAVTGCPVDRVSNSKPNLSSWKRKEHVVHSSAYASKHLYLHQREKKKVQTLAVNILSTSPIAGWENMLRVARTLSRLSYRRQYCHSQTVPAGNMLDISITE